MSKGQGSGGNNSWELPQWGGNSSPWGQSGNSPWSSGFLSNLSNQYNAFSGKGAPPPMQMPNPQSFAPQPPAPAPAAAPAAPQGAPGAPTAASLTAMGWSPVGGFGIWQSPDGTSTMNLGTGDPTFPNAAAQYGGMGATGLLAGMPQQPQPTPTPPIIPGPTVPTDFPQTPPWLSTDPNSVNYHKLPGQWSGPF